jgi:Kdo2-lipid IVA lauroyltransferase/acyltransferase
MDAIIFYLFYSLNWIITLLPLRVLYLFSGIIYFFLCYFPGYRKKIVSTNLRNAFPEKPEKELKSIEKKFYSHLADLIIETLKLTHMSRQEMRKRMIYENPELLSRLHREGRDIVCVLGHYNNWEWYRLITELSGHTFISVYKPLKNKYFDSFMNSLRSKYDAVLSPMSMILREVLTYRKRGILTLSAYLTDQTPAKGEIQYWTTFLNQDTPVYLGPAKIASKFNMAVIFMNIQKVKRGYYKTNMELLIENTGGLTEINITETHVKRLDELIRQRPEFWIWSHRRWKHKRETQNG